MFGYERERPLLQPKRGAFLDADFRSLGMAAEGGEQGEVALEADGIIAPMTGRDHPPVEVEDAGPFQAFESGNSLPVPIMRERGNDVHALLAFCRGVPGPTLLFRSARKAAISRSSSHNRASIGSAISLHGMP